MVSVSILFYFDCNDSYETMYHVFEVSTSIMEDIDDFIKECEEEHEGYEFGELMVSAYDPEYGDPEEFDSLLEYAEYVENVEEYGEAYSLRYEDVGECDMEQYAGCYEELEDYGKEVYEVPNELFNYIDWESLTEDLLTDYSTYDGNDGIHIFRDF